MFSSHDLYTRFTFRYDAYACADNVYKTFIARYGGDVFIIIAETAGSGYSHYNDGIDEFRSAMSEADEALYRDKKAAG